MTVVIPVWNSPDCLARCLRALQAQTYPRELTEVIVVDNGSTDSTPEVARSFPFATLLSEPRPGSYAARNAGLAQARGRYLAFTDADCVPDPAWLERAVAAKEANPQSGIIAGRIDLFTEDPEADPACETFERMFAFQQEANARKGHCVTANWLSDVELLRSLGGFRADLKSGGDIDLARRIVAAGRPIVYAPDARVGHPTRGVMDDLIAKRRRTVGGNFAAAKGLGARVRVAATQLFDGARRLRKVLANRELKALEKAKISWVTVRVTLAGVAEIGRLAMGGEPRRA